MAKIHGFIKANADYSRKAQEFISVHYPELSHVRVAVTDTIRGRAFPPDLRMAIPFHAYFSHEDGYFHYYVAHELAHITTWNKYRLNAKPHGQEFMAELKRLCPPEYLHYEAGYKPRNAAKAGITKATK